MHTIDQQKPLTTVPAAGTGRRPEVVVLSSSLLTDRMLLYSGFLREASGAVGLRVWATSANARSRECWSGAPAEVAEFPRIRRFREFPFNYLRRLNEFAWDFRLQPPSRLSMMRHVRDAAQPLHVRALKVPARAVARVGAERVLEDAVERLCLTYSRSADAVARLRERRPDVLFTMGPHRFEEPAVAAEAKNLGIPTLAMIASWDNLSTKNRMVFKYDGYVVWSEQMRRELLHFYPASRDVPVYVVGAPQFDVFFQPRFAQSRAGYCAARGLRPELPIVLHTLGSPNFIREHHAARALAERVAAGDLGDVQLLVRPHPMFDNGAEAEMLRGFGPRVIVQRTGEAGAALTARSQDAGQVVDWVNTFRHADVVVNMASTTVVDAAICGRPVVNIDYDPEPGHARQQLVKEVNHLWTHFKPVAESGGVWNVNDDRELVDAVRGYLRDPSLYQERRRWIAEHVCGFVDGRCGERLAAAVSDFAGRHAPAHAGAAR